jgi:transposase
MTQDDALYRFRVRAFALAEEMGSVRAACRALGIHHSTFYRWRAQVQRFGLEILHPRERRRPRMPNATSPFVEQRVLGYALAHPTQGPARISAELKRPKWGGIKISPNGVHKVLRRHGLNTRAKRLGLVAGYAAPSEPIESHPQTPPERHIDVDHPGELVQLDCFHIGRLSGTKGTVWQYTAIDVASSYVWAELHITPKNPSARWTSALARRVAQDLGRKGWRLEAVMSDMPQSSAATSSKRLWNGSRHVTCSSAPVGRRATAMSNASRGRSSRNAGSLPLPATSSPDTPACAMTSRSLPALLQQRSIPQRSAHQRPDPWRDHREGEDVVALRGMRRHYSVTGQLRAHRSKSPIARIRRLLRASLCPAGSSTKASSSSAITPAKR